MSNLYKKDDRELIFMCRDGDNQAFQTLLTKYNALVFKVSYDIVEDYYKAQDISQEVFVKFFENLRKFAPPYNIKNWLCKVAKNLSINYLKKQDKIKYFDESQIDAVSSLEKKLIITDKEEEVKKALDKLTDKNRKTIFLRLIEDYSVSEISSMLRIPESSVYGRLRRAKKQLKKELSNIIVYSKKISLFTDQKFNNLPPELLNDILSSNQIQEIENKYYTGIKIKNLESENYKDEIFNILKIRQNELGIIQTPTGTFKALVREKALLPLNEYIDNYYKKLPPQLQGVEEIARVDNQLFGIPTRSIEGTGYPHSQGIVILWNKELFEKLNLPDLHQLQKEGKWTWKKLIEISELLVKYNKDDEEIDLYALGGCTKNPTIFAYIMFATYGAPTMSLEGGHPISHFNNPRTMEALKLLQEMYNKKIIIPPNKQKETSERFYRGDLGMFIAQLRGVKFFNKDHKNISLAYLPKGPYQDEYILPLNRVYLAGVPKKVKNPSLMIEIHDDLFPPERVEHLVKRTAQEKTNYKEDTNFYQEMSTKWQLMSISKANLQLTTQYSKEEVLTEKMKKANKKIFGTFDKLAKNQIKNDEIPTIFEEVSNKFQEALDQICK